MSWKPAPKLIRHDVRSVEVIEVILVRHLRGSGAENDPARIVETYWRMDGTLLLEHDTWEAAAVSSAL